MLLSAITRPETLDFWLAPIARHGIPLAGIWSPAMLTGALLKAAGAQREHVLMVSLHSGGGLRQTWLSGREAPFLASRPRSPNRPGRDTIPASWPKSREPVATWSACAPGQPTMVWTFAC